MPQLTRVIVLLFIQFILELNISLTELTMEFRFVCDVVEIEWSSGREDGRVFAEVSVVWVIQAVFDEVSHKHFNPPRSLSPPSQPICSNVRVFLELFKLVLGEMIRSLLPGTLV